MLHDDLGQTDVAMAELSTKEKPAGVNRRA
jgi:hypothetical protein